MTKYRQYILVAILGAMLLYFGGEKLWDTLVTKPLGDLNSKIERINREIDKQHDQLARGREQAEELSVWEGQSLPSNSDRARSLYQAWLFELVKHVGLSSPSVDAGEPSDRRGLYQSLAFSLRGRGTLDQLTQFLFEFYRAGHLHQIRSLSITPMGKMGELDLSISIDTLILPGADRADRLSEAVSDRLAFDKLDDYRVIAQRNLFGAGNAADPADHTYLTAVNYVDGTAEALAEAQTGDKIVKVATAGPPGAAPTEIGSEQTGTLRLHKGDTFRVGQFQGTILEIDGDDVVLDSANQHWLLTVGENLSEAAALPAGL